MPSVNLPDAVESYLGGYSSAATVAAYRCDLALWQRYCVEHGLDPLGTVVRADLERYARMLEHDGRAPPRSPAGWPPWSASTAGAPTSNSSTTVPHSTRAAHQVTPARVSRTDWPTGSTPASSSAATPTRWRACLPSTGCALARSALPTWTTSRRTGGITP